MKLLSGKELSERILRNLKGAKAKLSVVLVGDDAVSKTYIAKKKEAAENIGIEFELRLFPEHVSQKDLQQQIEKIAKDADGVIVQLPLPKHLEQNEVLSAIPMEKDVDVLSPESFERFLAGDLPILPPIVCAVSELFKEYGVKVKGRRVAVVGAGRLVGRPIAIWLKKQGAIVSVLNSSTKDIASQIRKAEIVITGVGKPNLITGDMIQEGAIVVDAGTSVEDGKSSGDIDFDSVSKKAGMLSPVPGGVGPLTVSCLLRNLMTLKQQ